MNESFDYIERYFTKTLPPDEREAFENRCLSDPAFAEELAFYISLRDNVKQDLHEQKRKEFAELHSSLSAVRPSPGLVVRLWPYAAVAAACLILFWAWSTFFIQPSPQKIAGSYIQKNFSSIGITMGNDSADLLQAGVAAYNHKNFAEAEKIFQSLHTGPQQSEAYRYSGILYLTTGQYNKALLQFDTLSKNPQLYANPGIFYKAITLMKRSGKGDREEARILLREVIQKDLPGAREAKEWISAL